MTARSTTSSRWSGAVDGILAGAGRGDVRYFLDALPGRARRRADRARRAGVLGAYRWQYIVSGAQHPRFAEFLGTSITTEQGQRIARALAPLMT